MRKFWVVSIVTPLIADCGSAQFGGRSHRVSDVTSDVNEATESPESGSEASAIAQADRESSAVDVAPTVDPQSSAVDTGSTVDPITSTVDVAAAQEGQVIAQLQIAGCPTRHTHIVVFDLKSGWWTGDGGNTYRLLFDHLTSACSSLVNVEFIHALEDNVSRVTFPSADTDPSTFSGNFSEPGFLESVLLRGRVDAYDQIWLLSGYDPAGAGSDIDEVSSAALVNAIRDANRPVFIGAGHLAFFHANALSHQLLGEEPFLFDQPSSLPEVPRTLFVASAVTEAEATSNHPLMEGALPLAERCLIYPQSPYPEGENFYSAAHPIFSTEAGVLFSMPLQTSLTTVAKRPEDGAPTIAAGTYGVTARRIILDGGLPKFYAVHANTDRIIRYSPDSVATADVVAANMHRYTQNIVLYLSGQD